MSVLAVAGGVGGGGDDRQTAVSANRARVGLAAAWGQKVRAAAGNQQRRERGERAGD
jgi:hypothetical protein